MNAKKQSVRGRPRDASKRDALLSAARSLLFGSGANAATMDEIITAAGVSRATLYSHFSDKTALVEAVLARETSSIVAEEWNEADRPNDPIGALRHFGERYVAFLAVPERIDCERVLAQMAKTAPDLARRFFDAGPGRAQAVLTKLIQAAQEAGAISSGEPGGITEDLMGIWSGHWRTRMTFGVGPTPDQAEIQRIVERGLDKLPRPDSSE